MGHAWIALVKLSKTYYTSGGHNIKCGCTCSNPYPERVDPESEINPSIMVRNGLLLVPGIPNALRGTTTLTSNISSYKNKVLPMMTSD